MKPNKEASNGGRQGNFALHRFNEHVGDEESKPVDFSVALQLGSLSLSKESTVTQVGICQCLWAFLMSYVAVSCVNGWACDIAIRGQSAHCSTSVRIFCQRFSLLFDSSL